MVYTIKFIEAIAECYESIKDDRDDQDVAAALMDYELGLDQLQYKYVSLIYEHKTKGIPFRELERLTGLNRESLRRRYNEGISKLWEIMNDLG